MGAAAHLRGPARVQHFGGGLLKTLGAGGGKHAPEAQQARKPEVEGHVEEHGGAGRAKATPPRKAQVEPGGEIGKVGAEQAINKSYNAISVNPAVLDCDYYRFAELDAGAVNAYANEYMSQYYWADFMFESYD